MGQALRALPGTDDSETYREKEGEKKRCLGITLPYQEKEKEKKTLRSHKINIGLLQKTFPQKTFYHIFEIHRV